MKLDFPIKTNEFNFSSEDIEIILKMLKKERNINYNDWISIGICLHNISSEYIKLWIDLSKSIGNYIDGDCEKKWKTFKKNKNGLGIGSLLSWAKEDNFEKYEEFMKQKKSIK